MAFLKFINKPDIGYAAKWLDYQVLLRLCGLLPAPLAYWAARQRARYRYRVRHDARAAARQNMRELLSGFEEAELERNVLEFFYSPCLDELEGYFLPHLTMNKLEKLMKIEERARLDECLQKGRGAILFSNHSGSVVLFLLALGLMGYKINVIGRPLDEENNPLHPVVLKYARPRVAWVEKHLGRQFIAPAKGNSAVLADCLRANECVFTLLDVPPEIVRKKVTVKFFDRDCLFPSGFARLAKETGCAMIPCEKYYLPDWVHQKLVFKEPFYSSGDITLDVQNCVSHLERMIRLHPSQWWMWDNAAMLWESLNKTCGNPAQSL